jgi:peptide deformylase
MPNALPLTLYPTKSLQEKSRPLTAAEISDPELQDFIANMEVTMKKEHGIGLAAPQVGRNIRLCIIGMDSGPLALINPKITWRSIRKEIDSEGCLSIPRVFGNVKRSRSIKVKAIGRDGQPITLRADGLFARVIQHEVDHLDGILFIDRTKDITDGIELLERYAKSA